ncbi:MAG: ABC transporter ATP-binding protein [Oscillospiraceae bacterium]|nr:ABC transporter ATP-binding protein [Oscillospiraceae bacterium]MBP3699758.1 ABC transporter ATP-binding protein [Oscillospiraceae bacterium]
MIDMQHLNKSYWADKTEVPVLKDVCFTVEEGEYVSIMGPSGSGKSTLMNIIGCLDVPSAGTYLLNGESVSEKSDSEMSKLRNSTIGFVFQNFNLLPRETALENVALPLLYGGVGRKERTERARQALEDVGLGDRLTFFPTQLSGGQKQRVAIARAMVGKPKLLLADEPTGALDTASGKQIMALFRELNKQGVTIVMITHEPEIAAYADRTLYIRDGQLSEGGGGR